MVEANRFADEELVNALKHPKQTDAGIRQMYIAYYGLLESYVLKNSGTKDDAADIIQETFVAFINIVQEDKFRGDASVKSFLFSIARNLWLSELRKRSNADSRNRIFETAKDTIDDQTIPQLVRQENTKAIQQLFTKLGEKCKQLLMLVYYENLAMSEIVMQMPDYQNEQVLRNKKYKCMKQLEQMINDNEPLRIQLKNALNYAG